MKNWKQIWTFEFFSFFKKFISFRWTSSSSQKKQPKRGSIFIDWFDMELSETQIIYNQNGNFVKNPSNSVLNNILKKWWRSEVWPFKKKKNYRTFGNYPVIFITTFCEIQEQIIGMDRFVFKFFFTYKKELHTDKFAQIIRLSW